QTTRPPRPRLSPYTTLFRSRWQRGRLMQPRPFVGIAEQRPGAFEIAAAEGLQRMLGGQRLQQIAVVIQTPARRQMVAQLAEQHRDRKSTRLNSSHVKISYAV